MGWPKVNSLSLGRDAHRSAAGFGARAAAFPTAEIADPQSLVHEEASLAHGVHSVDEHLFAVAVVDAGDVARAVVDEPSGHPLRELGVLAGVEQEGVPPDVDEGGHPVEVLLALGVQEQVAERLVQDSPGPVALRLHGLVAEVGLELEALHDAGLEPLLQLLTDEVLVDQLDAGLDPGLGNIHGHGFFLSGDGPLYHFYYIINHLQLQK